MLFDELLPEEVLKDARDLVAHLATKLRWSDKRIYEACKCLVQAFDAYLEFKERGKNKDSN